jgi:atlastin
MNGKPIKIIEINNKSLNEIKLNEDNLKLVLNDSAIRDHSVCIISVAGAFRKGKSFLLSLFIRFLTNNGWNNPNWMGDENEDFPFKDGFFWSGGAERITTGIWLWSKPFIFESSEKKVKNISLMFWFVLV